MLPGRVAKILLWPDRFDCPTYPASAERSDTEGQHFRNDGNDLEYDSGRCATQHACNCNNNRSECRVAVEPMGCAPSEEKTGERHKAWIQEERDRARAMEQRSVKSACQPPSQIPRHKKSVGAGLRAGTPCRSPPRLGKGDAGCTVARGRATKPALRLVQAPFRPSR